MCWMEYIGVSPIVVTWETRSPLVSGSEVPGHPQWEHEPVVAADHLDSQLLVLDTRHHRFRLSVMRLPSRPGSPHLPVAVDK